MANKVPANGAVPTMFVASVAPAFPMDMDNPCEHPRDKKKRRYVVYIAEEEIDYEPTGKFYVGRTSGTGTVTQIVNKRQQGHHRTDIGKLKAIHETDSYSACRGAEQKHYEDMVAKNQAITSPRAKGRGAQIAPIAADNRRKQKYLDCAQASARHSHPGCPICGA